MDDALHLLQRRLDEAVACSHVYSSELQTTAPPELQSQLELGAASAEENLHIIHSSIDKALRFQEGSAAADVRATLPPAYSAPGHPLQCCVTASSLSRAWVDATNLALADQARLAAVEGTEALVIVLEALREALGAGAAAASAASPLQHARDPGRPEHGPPLRVALLKLDHMRDRRGYTRLICRWCAELQLTGRLLLWSADQGRSRLVILILLEGRAGDIREYLLRQRTRPCDVDSKGRPCKERMMDVLCEADSGKMERAFASFSVQECSSRGEAEGCLGCVGLPGHWLSHAAGIPVTS